MKGYVFKGDRVVELVERDKPTVGPGQVLIRTKTSSICGTDLHVYRAPAATVGSAAFQGGEYAPMDHNLIWIPWDDTIYSSYSACMRRGAYLAGVYTDIVDYQCRNRSTVNVRPTRFGMMLEVKRS